MRTSIPNLIFFCLILNTLVLMVLYQPDRIMSRNNLDHKHINNSGKYLLSLCKESGLRILNGRTTGDLTGQPTCITYNGCSLVDYCLVSKDILNSVGYFEVLYFTFFSDNRRICRAIFDSFCSEPCSGRLNNLQPIPGKCLWNNDAIES